MTPIVSYSITSIVVPIQSRNDSSLAPFIFLLPIHFLFISEKITNFATPFSIDMAETKQNILIVEDDPTFGLMLQTWLVKNGYKATLMCSIEQAKIEVVKGDYRLILTDLRLPDGDGIVFMSWVREKIDSKIQTIVMTGYAEVQTAVLAMKMGAFDYLRKPINTSVLQSKIEAALNAEEDVVAPVELNDKTVIVKGKSPVMQRLYKHIDLVAPTKMSVLILGESGTGKEYIARLIHDTSRRKNGPFIAVDCGSMSKELAPSELFGHKKGSFTSAVSDKKGVFELASGGTVFLDEVGNLPYDVQKQLLRALQEQKIRPVGAVKDIDTDIRIIAATNENIEKAISEGNFREDLFHRINEFMLQLPPLRDRIEDLEEFSLFFLRQANEELGKNIKGIDELALLELKRQRWTGNLRELRNVIRRSVLFADGDMIEVGDLPVFSSDINRVDTQRHGEERNSFALRPDNEKEQIEAALEKARGNKTVAAKLLQIDRKTLYNKMHLYGISLKKE